MSYYLSLYLPDSCTGAGTLLYLGLPEDGALAPKHVVFSEIYLQFVMLLCAFVGKCDWL